MDKQPKASLSLDLSEEEVAHLLMKRSGAAPAKVASPAVTTVIVEIGKHTLEDAELAVIGAAMEFAEGRRGRVCEMLRISRPTLARKLKLIEKRKGGAA